VSQARTSNGRSDENNNAVQLKFPEGELPCLIVYSDQKHVGYINHIPSQLEQTLTENRFKPQRLSHEIWSGEDYLNKIIDLTDKCVLAIVILDGFRPNVLFEFGLLKGRLKPVIILKSRQATINIKSLFRTTQDSGLTVEEFRRLDNPIIDGPYHLSDFAGKHVSQIDIEAGEQEQQHPSVVLKKELAKNRSTIEEEIKKVKTKGLDADILHDILPPLFKVITFYTGSSTFDVDELVETHEELASVANKHGTVLTPDIESMVGATYILKANEVGHSNVKDAIRYCEYAINVYNNIIKNTSPETNQIVYASTQKKLGSIYSQIGLYQDKSNNLKLAIAAFIEALAIYTFNRSPIDYALTQASLGNAYHRLGVLENPVTSCKKAVHSYREALRVFSLNSYPFQYGAIQNNLGNVYKTLASIHHSLKDESPVQIWRKALVAYRESLKIYTILYPIMYANLQNNIGGMHQNLAMYNEEIRLNTAEALDAFDKALEVHTKEKFPREYANTKYNIGVAYMKLMDLELTDESRNIAITSFREALKVYNLRDYPQEYANTQMNLGNVYLPLVMKNFSSQDCNNAIHAYDEALKVYTIQQSDFDYAMLQYSKGLAYSKLFELEKVEENCKNAIDSFNQSLKVINEQNHAGIYKSVKELLKTIEPCNGK
jgi:tetratricopeptide (TPR) repeat protein